LKEFTSSPGHKINKQAAGQGKQATQTPPGAGTRLHFSGIPYEGLELLPMKEEMRFWLLIESRIDMQVTTQVTTKEKRGIFLSNKTSCSS